MVIYPRPVRDALAAFEEAVLAQAPPGSVLVGSAVSPDGMNGVALTILPTANDYAMDDVFERVDDRWVAASGSSGGSGIGWTSSTAWANSASFATQTKRPPGPRPH